jgi:two-component sensor histidine kinase
VVRRNAFHIGEYTQSRLTDVAVLPLALPLRNKEGRTIAILTSGIRLDWLNDRIRDRGLGERGALTIADRNGIIIARNPQPERFVGTRIPDSFQHLINGPSEGVMDVMSQDGTPRVIAYSPTTRPPEGLYISVGISKSDAYADVNRQTFIAALSIALGSIIALAAAWLAGGLIRRPVNRIVSVIKAWQAGVGNARTGFRASDGDVELVGEALDRMLNELDQRSTEIKRAEGQRDLLMRELAHRVKNTLTLVQAIAHQTFRGRDPELTRSFAERLIALAGAYDVLLGKEFAGGDVRAIVSTALKPHLAREDAVTISGDACLLAPHIALSLSMVIHELATNATKYGALSTDRGNIFVSWTVNERRVALLWHERGGPPVSVPNTEGFGSKLMRRAFGSDAEAFIDIKYLLSGVRCELHFNAGEASDHGAAGTLAAS